MQFRIQKGVKMSRTYRRKKVTEARIIEDTCYQYVSSNIIKRYCREFINCSKNCPARDDKYTVSKYRRDTRIGYGWRGNAPAGFRRCVERTKRAKYTAETRRILKQGDYENYSYAVDYKDAGWLYW